VLGEEQLVDRVLDDGINKSLNSPIQAEINFVLGGHDF